MKSKILKKILCGAVALGIWSGSSYGFQFSPIAVNIEIAKKSEETFTVKNDSDDPIAVELSLKHRVMTEKGVDVLSDADDDFVFFPQQMIVKPRSTQSVRIQYVGEKTLKSEKAYRIIAEQLPVNLEAKSAEKSGGKIQIMLRYVGSVYIQPQGVKSKLIVKSIERASNEKGQQVLRVSIENKGSRHTLIERPTLTIGSVQLSESELSGLANENILAQMTRVFEIPLPARLSRVSVLLPAELNYSESY